MSYDGNLAALDRYQAQIDRGSAAWEIVKEQVDDGDHTDAIIEQVIADDAEDVLDALLCHIVDEAVEAGDRRDPRPENPTAKDLRRWHRRRARRGWMALRAALEHWKGFEAFLDRYIEEEAGHYGR